MRLHGTGDRNIAGKWYLDVASLESTCAAVNEAARGPKDALRAFVQLLSSAGTRSEVELAWCTGVAVAVTGGANAPFAAHV